MRTKQQKLDYTLAWQRANPAKRKVIRDRWYKNHRNDALKFARAWKYKSQFGITIEEFDALLEKQGHKCAICGKYQEGNTNKNRFSIDHDHITGKVRGLLCSQCNLSLGGFQDNSELLLKAALYLENAKSP